MVGSRNAHKVGRSIKTKELLERHNYFEKQTMAHLYEHCYDCERWLGRDWEEVHKWLDDLFAEYGPAHRCHRHHLEGIEEVRQQWGDEAAIAAKIHILVDCWGLPSKADYGNRFVNQFGQEEGSTWEEAWKMIQEIRNKYPVKSN